MAQILIATQFHRYMKSGKSEPAIFGCEEQSGKWAGDYVVKLRGGLETGEAGLLREMIGSKLATYFGLATPEPAVVKIEADLAELIAETEPEHAAQIRRSVGLNFGSKLMTGFTGWPQDKSIPEAMWQVAVDIFAFDALIQNPDRRDGNSNLFTKGDAVMIYDHEMAFSFLLDLLPSESPWKLEDQRYLTNHVFFRRLKSKSIDLSGFMESLIALSHDQIRRIAGDVPTEWNNGNWSRIEAHLRTMRDHADEFAEEIRRRLV